MTSTTTATITLYRIEDEDYLLTEEEIEDGYRDLLDTDGTVTVAGYEYEPSRILAEVDPIAYRVGLSDYSATYDEVQVPLTDYLSDDFDAAEWLEAHA